MPIVTKNPTATTAIIAGWINPTNAYTDNGVSTYSDTGAAEQKYTTWGFTTTDIPAGATITKVEMGAEHYETIDWYTYLNHVNSAGLSYSYQLTVRAALTWDWINITAQESAWNLTILNAKDIRIVSTNIISEGCVHPDTAILMEDNSLKPAKDIKIGDKVVSLIKPDGSREIGKVIAMTHHYRKRPFRLIGLFEDKDKDIALNPLHLIRTYNGETKAWESIKGQDLSRRPLPFIISGITDDGSKWQPRVINFIKMVEANYVVNIEVDKEHFYGSYVHIHNLAKFTCYADVIALRVTYEIPVVAVGRKGESLTLA